MGSLAFDDIFSGALFPAYDGIKNWNYAIYESVLTISAGKLMLYCACVFSYAAECDGTYSRN